MDYEKDFNIKYSDAFAANRQYMKHALELEERENLRQLNAPTISEESYKREILPFWEKSDRKPDKFWFEYFGSRDGIVEAGFISSDLYYSEILPYINNVQMRFALTDKNYYEKWFRDVKQPKSICHRIAGLYYDHSMNMIDGSEAVKLCLSHEGRLFIKPSIYGHNSINISVMDTEDTDEKSVTEIFEKLGGNFVVQEEICQHDDLSLLNPTCVNTIRVNSFLRQNEVHVTSPALRVGAAGERVVASGSGGWCVEIENDGTLNKRALMLEVEKETYKENYKWIDTCSVQESGYRVPAIDRIIESVKKMHPLMPHLKWIGWDFTVNKESDPVLIEFNAVPGIKHQLVTCKPIFGEMTQYIIDDYYIHRTMEKNQRQGIIPV